MLALQTVHQEGFSLIEMAVVVVIIALLVGGLLVPLSLQTEMTNLKFSEQALEEVKEMLIGFALAYRRLPCPATPSSGGQESFSSGNTTTGGVCTARHGFVPAVTLGISGSVNEDGLLLDVWGNPYRYSVTNSNSSAFTTFTSSNGIATIGFASLTPDLQICIDMVSDPTCVNKLATKIPAVIFTMGKNWATTNSGNVNEWQNAGTTTLGGGPSSKTYPVHVAGATVITKQFVSTAYCCRGDTPRNKQFDDVVVWLSPNALYYRMVAAGVYP